MKALFTIIFIAFFSITSGFSQAADSLQSAKFQTYATTGVKGGINISSLNNFNNSDIRIGLVAGLTREFRFSKLLGLAIELNYSQHGTTIQHVDYGLNYMALPVLITLHDNNFAVQAGAYGAVLLKSKSPLRQNNRRHYRTFYPDRNRIVHWVGLSFLGQYGFWFAVLPGAAKLKQKHSRQSRNLSQQHPAGYRWLYFLKRYAISAKKY